VGQQTSLKQLLRSYISIPANVGDRFFEHLFLTSLILIIPAQNMCHVLQIQLPKTSLTTEIGIN
jgi:hypothetical protein